MIETTLRKASLEDIVTLLQQQADVKYDIVVPAGRLRYVDGRLHVAEGAVRWDENGAMAVDAMLAPTETAEEGVASRLGIPRAYLRTLRSTGQRVALGSGRPVNVDAFDGVSDVYAPSLLDLNVNGWLQSDPNRKFLVRAFRTDDPDEVGIFRALLSNRFAMLDNLDFLLAALAGARDAGIDTHSLRVQSNLSERGMRVNITAPQVAVHAADLVANYRSPYSGLSGRDLPVVWAGLSLGNSETGGGAWTVTPRIEFEVCGNGMTMKRDVLREVHLGAALPEGVIRWTADTGRKALDLVTAKTRDAVQTFLDREYVESVLNGLREKAGIPITEPVATIERVASVHGFTESEQASILDCFIKSGDTSAFGVVQAVTAAAQSVDDPDRAAEMEDAAFAVLDTAASSA